MGNFWSSTTPIIDDHVNKHCVVMYSTTICSYCTKAKQIMADLNIDCNIVELNLLNSREGGDVSQNLMQKTNNRTVPQIFINGEFIGGYSEMLQLKKTGSLFEKISKCSNTCFKSSETSG